MKNSTCLWIALLLAALLAGLTSGHAGSGTDKGSLMFSVEMHPGKRDYITCQLSINGQYAIYTKIRTIKGALPAQEGRRILAAFEKLCLAAGKERFLPVSRIGGMLKKPSFLYISPQSTVLQLQGLDTPPPEELTEFMRMLWLKLQDNASKNLDKKHTTDRRAPESLHHPSFLPV